MSTPLRKKYGDAVLEQGKVALDEVRKPLFAVVGATELAYDQIRTQLKDLPVEAQAQLRKLPVEAQTQLKKLPTEAQAQLKKLQERAQSGISPIQVRQTVEQAAQTVEQAAQNAAAQTREAYGTYRSQAQETYEALAHRGELLVRRLRRRPEARNAFEETEAAIGRTEKMVEQAGEKVTSKPAVAPAAVHKAPARKAPARRASTTRPKDE